MNARRQWIARLAGAAVVAGVSVPAVAASILVWVHTRYPESIRGPGPYAYLGGGPFQLWMLAWSLGAGAILLALGVLLKRVAGDGLTWKRFRGELLAVAAVLAALVLPRFVLPPPPGPEARTGAERNFARYAADQVWRRLTAPYRRVGPLPLRGVAEAALLVWVTGWRVTDIEPIPGECGVREYRGWDVGSHRGIVRLYGPFGLPWRSIPFACPEAEGSLDAGVESPPRGEAVTRTRAGAVNRSPTAVTLHLGHVRQETSRGEPVYLLRPVAHIRIGAPEDVAHVRLELYRPDDETRPVGRYFATRVDGAWVFDWEDPPAEPHRLVILGERDGGGWTPMARVLVKGIDPGTGDATGVLTQSVPDAPALEEVIRRFFDLTSRRRHADAWELVHPRARRPNPGISEEQAKAAFVAQPPGPALEAILGMQLRASRKFPWCMCSVVEVAEVLVRFADGSERVIHAQRTEAGVWRVLWVPE